MKFEDFKASLSQSQPPAGLSLSLQALWHEAQEDWDGAHDILQNDDTRDGSWVHAYLHRKEGDLPNARYWYNRAGRSMPDQSLAEEWESISQTLINKE